MANAIAPFPDVATSESQAVSAADRYEGLDGLRGVAAIAVILLHLSIVIDGQRIFESAYLAVDFFFMLSGFVIANAYDSRLGSTVRFRQYFGKRLIRLLPLVWLGLALALPLFVASGGLRAADTLLFVTTFAAWMATLPAIWDGQPWLLNRPHWSLFWELAINLIYGAWLWRLSTRHLVYLTLCGGGAVLLSAIACGGLDIGTNLASMPFGAVRVWYAFPAGVVLSRTLPRWPMVPLNWKVGAVGLICLMSLPFGIDGRRWLDISADFLVFPILIVGAAQHVPKGIAASIAKVSGALSYPAYALHWPLIALIHPAGRAAHHFDLAFGPAEKLVWCTAILGFSWIALKLYDEPVRNLLSRVHRDSS